MIHAAWHWFLHVTGTSNETGPFYAFWSGFGSDLGELTLIGTVAAAWRTQTCHASFWCWRHGRHPTADGVYRLCAKHHPDVPRRVTLAHIHAEHHRARARAQRDA